MYFVMWLQYSILVINSAASFIYGKKIARKRIQGSNLFSFKMKCFIYAYLHDRYFICMNISKEDCKQFDILNEDLNDPSSVQSTLSTFQRDKLKLDFIIANAAVGADFG